jgi:GTPase SAR1 family protein
MQGDRFDTSRAAILSNLILTHIQSIPSSNTFDTMDAPQILPKLPDYVRFRVLIIGKANAGKTTILQRVCNTTESPEIHRIEPSGAGYPTRVRSRF